MSQPIPIVYGKRGESPPKCDAAEPDSWGWQSHVLVKTEVPDGYALICANCGGYADHAEWARPEGVTDGTA